METLVALVVIGVAISSIAWCFSQSLDIAEKNRHRKAALALAEEQLHDLTAAPQKYDWSALKTAPAGEQVEITAQGQPRDAAHLLSGPAVMPIEPRAGRREADLYAKFEWQAFARVTGDGGSAIEVTVAVSWPERGRRSLVTLTSALPRAWVEGMA